MHKRIIPKIHYIFIVLFAFSISGCSSMMKNMMVEERVSPYDMDKTVDTIVTRAKEKGWAVPGVKKLDKAIKKRGGPSVLPVRLIELCQPHYAGKILQDDEARYASVMMPCTISVYQKSDGKTYVANMKARQIGQKLGGTIAEVMGGGVADDQDYFLEFLSK